MPPFNMNGAPDNSNSSTQPQSNPGETMTFMESLSTCFKKYADFNGRASRAEYWWWALFCFIVGAACGSTNQWAGGVIQLALLVPSLAVAWRRLHDMGRAGGYWFICLIPLVGWIFLIIWLVKPSEPMPNRFGNVPVK